MIHSKRTAVHVLFVALLAYVGSSNVLARGWPIEETMHTKDAIKTGENSVKLVTGILESIGQGDFYRRASEFCSKIKEIKIALHLIGKSFDHKNSFVFGVYTAIKAMNIEEFVTKANFTKSQADLIKKIYLEISQLLQGIIECDEKDRTEYIQTWTLAHRKHFEALTMHPDIRPWLELMDIL